LELPGGYEDDRPAQQIASDPNTPPDDWDLQMMLTVRYIAAFVLPIERRRGGLRARAAEGTMALVGSSTLVKELRERIARVASTDFTLLSQGIGAEPHPY
jgi:DNA-binding NtrC family response regulator